MSTSATVYNLNKKTGYYLDSGYWLKCECESLIASAQIYRSAVTDALACDERGKAWLQGLCEWLAKSPSDTFVVVLDTSVFEFNGPFGDYKIENV